MVTLKIARPRLCEIGVRESRVGQGLRLPDSGTANYKNMGNDKRSIRCSETHLRNGQSVLTSRRPEC